MLHITPFERTVLEYLAAGATASEIADKVRLNEHEVNARLQGLFTRMGVATRTEAVAAATRRGLLAA